LVIRKEGNMNSNNGHLSDITDSFRTFIGHTIWQSDYFC